MWKQIKQGWRTRYVQHTYRGTDTDRLRSQKYGLANLSVLLVLLGLVWVGLAAWLANPYVWVLPLAYVGLILWALWRLYTKGNLDKVRNAVILSSILHPFFLQWLMGGLSASGFVMLWAMLPLAGSWVCSSYWQTQRWLILFVLLCLISGFTDALFVELFARGHTHSTFLFVINGTMLGVLNFTVAILFAQNARRLRLLLRGQLNAINRTMLTAQYTPDGAINSLSEEFARAMGYTPEDLIGKKHDALQPIWLNATDETQFWEQLSGGQTFEDTFAYLHRNQKMRKWLAGIYSPVVDESGQVTKVIQIVRDVSRERRRLQEYESQIRAFNRANAIVRLDGQGCVEQGNANFASLLGFSLIQVRGQHYADLLMNHADQLDFEDKWADILEGKRQEDTFLHRHHDRPEGCWIEIFYYLIEELDGLSVLLVLHDITDRKHYETQTLQANQALAEKNEILEHSAKILDEKNREIRIQNEQLLIQSQQLAEQSRKVSDSIQYASRIQQSILARKERITQSFDEAFVLLLPRDKVSGDFYWHAEVGDLTIVIAADCTGHGVPGAFMSLIGHNLLDQMVRMMGVTSPEMMLAGLHMGIQKTLRQQETQNRDGMDMTVCCIDRSQQKLFFAGAKNPLVYIQNGEMHRIKGDRLPVGGLQKEKRRLFTKHTIDLSQHETTFYIFSDGFQDQFGGERDRKFGSKNFRQLLFEIHQQPMPEQEVYLEKALFDWMNGQEQIDDVLIIGGRIRVKT
ncbi:MAG: PAS domain-containing protein [Bernardetiaceae bacterium]